MALLNIAIEHEFDTDQCINCGIFFAMPTFFRKERLRDHKTFYCPNGHGQHFSSESKEETLKRELDAASKAKSEATVKMWEAQTAQRNAEAKLQKFSKRASAGVCPCCKRTVSQMARHMKTKHPDFNKSEYPKENP